MRKRKKAIGRPAKGELSSREMEICSNMRRLREAAHMTREQLCEIVLKPYRMISPNTYRQYEIGNRRTPEWMIEAFTNFFSEDPASISDSDIEAANAQAYRRSELYGDPDIYSFLKTLEFQGVRLQRINDMNISFTWKDQVSIVTYERFFQIVDEYLSSVSNAIDKLFENNNSSGS